jgi:hypothetical protein
MDSASLSIILSVVTILLQIIVLLVVVAMNGKVSKKAPEAPVREQPDFRKEHHEDRGRPRDHGFEQRKPANQPSQPAPAVAPIDRSLRDINMRLKSAEKSQERVRQEFQGSGDQGQQRRPDNFRRDHQGRGRDQGRDRDRDRGGRHDNRRPPYGQRDQRPMQSRPQGFPESASAPSAITGSPAPLSEPISIGNIAPTQPAPVAAAERHEEDVEHGRKIIVKRRMLGPEGQEISTENRPLEGSQPAEGQAAPQQDNAPETQQTEVVYGRRR